MSTDESSFEQFESEYRPRFNTLVARINDLNLGLTREGASLDSACSLLHNRQRLMLHILCDLTHRPAARGDKNL